MSIRDGSELVRTTADWQNMRPPQEPTLDSSFGLLPGPHGLCDPRALGLHREIAVRMDRRPFGEWRRTSCSTFLVPPLAAAKLALISR
jgi:hypothetical protein